MGTHWRGDTPRTLLFATAAIYTEPTRGEGGREEGACRGRGLCLWEATAELSVCLSVGQDVDEGEGEDSAALRVALHVSDLEDIIPVSQAI